MLKKASQYVSGRLCEILWENEKIRVRDMETEEPFTYTNGSRGPIYVRAKEIYDCPGLDYLFTVLAFNETRKETGIKDHKYTVCGMHEGMKAFSEHFAGLYGVYCIGFKPNKENRGLLGDIILYNPDVFGELKKELPVIILEDVVNNGTNTTAAAKKLVIEGFWVSDIITMGWYGKEDSVREITEMGIGFHYLFDLDDVLDNGVRLGFINDGIADDVRLYIKDSMKWNKRWGYDDRKAD